ncbi:MAG: dehydrogenase E1 component subunit alpha/beta [Bacteroidota bacterium]
MQQNYTLTFEKKAFESSQFVHLYKHLLKPRLIEEKMRILLRQGKISKWFSGIGQEAIAVGSTLAMHEDEYILPMHRNLGVFTTRKVPLHRLFAQFQGKPMGFTKGRDRSFHFGSSEHRLVGMISHLGPQLSVADGIALANKLSDQKKAVLAFCGDGATSEGEFHEALNVAAVWDLPVIFIIENNGYGLSTPNEEQYRCEWIADKGNGYGMKAVQVEGNNIIEVYKTLQSARNYVITEQKPILVEALTFRMRGHEEASGTKYVPQSLIDTWAEKDPVSNYETFLLAQGMIEAEEVESFKNDFKQEIEVALQKAFSAPNPIADINTEYNDLFAPSTWSVQQPISSKHQNKRMVDAISEGLKQSMEKFSNLVLMGQDIAEYGGVFKITEGFTAKFGKARVRNTPLCESAIVGAALGLSVKGFKAMVEMQFADFVTCGFNQIVNNLAKIHYRWGQNADVVIRMPTGAGVKAGPFHSQSNEAWFFHTPGLKIVYPATPYAAKGLLTAAIEEPNPVMYFEHKALYRAISEEIPEDYYHIPIGKARVDSLGEDISIITYGMGVHWAREIIQQLPHISIEVIDLQTLLPWDKETVKQSVEKTNKVLVCNEDTLTGSIASEIAAWIAENCFEHLDAPVMREGSLDTPVPFAGNLEAVFLPQQRIKEKVERLFNY